MRPPDTHEDKCGACSNCESTFETIDVTSVAQAISRCVHDVNQRVGSGKIVKILRGSKAQDLAWLNPEQMPTFGMLKDVNEALRARCAESDGHRWLPVHRRRAYADCHVWRACC